MTVFFFDEGAWSQRYIEELGIQRVIEHLKQKGLPCEWPMKVPNIENPWTMKATVTASNYKSQCPYYRGYWLGRYSGVECAAAGEIIPGCVWYDMCSREYTACPFYKEREDLQNVVPKM